jgi:flavin reductase (DIM6/NTAB) family NADH-FMN oxidoreductase RutF
MTTRTFDPAAMATDQVRHLLNATIAPRPIAWIGSLAPNGKLNVAPHSYTTIFALTPPVVGFISTGRKDTLRNIERHGEFVYHIAGEALMNEMNLSSADFPPEISEVEWAKLTAVPSDVIATPRIAEAPVALEARLVGIQEIKTSNSFLILGEVVRIHAAESMMTGDRIDPAKVMPITRLAGNAYARMGEVFSMKRPVYADLQKEEGAVELPVS